MPYRASSMLRAALAATIALALAGCGRAEGDNAETALDGNDTDPAVTTALQDQIAVDRDLNQQSNRNAIRPAAGPRQAQYPAGGENLAAGPGGCANADGFVYGREWVSRLSAAFPPYPGGRVTDAGANNSNGCSARAVTFTTADDYQRVLDWYHTRAVGAGYSSEHQIRGGDHVLAGSTPGGAAFYLIATPAARGTEVALIATNGR